MISRVHSSILQGIDAMGCEVEADVTSAGETTVKLVGMAEAAVKESLSRIQAALRNSAYRWPGPKVTIKLAPGDVKKDSAALDLPIGPTTLDLSEVFRVAGRCDVEFADVRGEESAKRALTVAAAGRHSPARPGIARAGSGIPGGPLGLRQWRVPRLTAVRAGPSGEQAPGRCAWSPRNLSRFSA